MSALPTFADAASALRELYGEANEVLVIDSAAGTASVSSPGLDLHDLEDFVGRVIGTQGWVPTWIPAGLRLSRLDLTRPPDGSGMDVSFTVDAIAGGAGWVLAAGFVIEGASVEFAYDRGQLWGRVSGSALIDGMHLDVSVELPDEVFVGRLKSVSATEAAAFLRDHDLVAPAGGDRHPTGTTPELIDLSVYVGLRARRATLHVEARNLIDVAPLHVDRVEAEISFGDETRLSLRTDVTIDLGADDQGVTRIIVIDTGAVVGQDGWSFDGEVDLAAADGSPGVSCGFLIDGLAAMFSSASPHVPTFIRDLELESLNLSFDSATRDVSFGCALDWPDRDIDIQIALEHSAGVFKASATLTVGGLEFDLILEHSSGASTAVGVFRADGGVQVTLNDLVAALPHGVHETPAIGEFPAGFSFSVLDAVLAYESGSKLLFAADLGVGVDLSALGHVPLVGAMLPQGEALRLSFRAALSNGWTSAEIDALNDVLPEGVTKLPVSVADGPLIDARLELGSGEPFDLNIVRTPQQAEPQTGDVTAAQPSSASVTSAADATPSAVTWVDVDRNFGPLHLTKVGVHYAAATSEVTLLLGGSVSIAGLTLSVTGLGATYSLIDHHLAVSLDGLGVDFTRDPLQISGAFLRSDDGQGHQEFAGQVVIRTEAFAINAIGAFSTVHGAPSMFIYGVLDYPLGGPAFCFIEGLAVGFGYNRSFQPPAIDSVRSFPLVVDAVAAAGGTATPEQPDQKLAKLHDYIAPSIGEYFLAVGVKFSSFKLLDTFALFVVSFGEHTEIDLIGASTYQTPPAPLGSVPPMARVELNLLAHIAPDEGIVSVVGQLTPNSYVYSNLCHISGGFAFVSWFRGERAGDFVLSVGGYHPKFRPPPGYPVPPRIAIRYQVTPEISVSGSGYFALTPSAFMAGATLEASAHIGSLSASFRLSVDFLIGWEPYHYDANLSIDIAATWGWFHTNAHAALHIWGPDFSGYAAVQWAVFSFDVTFGAAAQRGPTPITWTRFREAFLPKSIEDACSIRVTAGAIGTTGNVAIVNPKELCFTTSSIIPEAIPTEEAIGIAPMNVASIGLSAQVINVTRGSVDVTSKFDRRPINTKFPSALWGTTIRRDQNAKPITAVSGYQLTPKEPLHAFESKEVDRSFLTDPGPPPERFGGHIPVPMTLAALDPEPKGMNAGWIPLYDGASRHRHGELPWDRFVMARATQQVVS